MSWHDFRNPGFGGGGLKAEVRPVPFTSIKPAIDLG